MDALSSNPIKSAALKGGAPKLTTAAPAKPAVAPQPAAPSTSLPQGPVTTRENGVSTTVTPDGLRSQTSDTGVSVRTGEQGQEISLPSGQSFRLDEQGVHSTGDESGQGATLSQTEDGALISFQDKEGNTVRVQPDSLTYEVLNKQKNLSQVFHPDGHQELVAFGKYRAPGSDKISDFEHRVLYSPSGELLDSQGFQGLAQDGRKLSFELPGGVRTERTLAKPLPGQPAFEETAPAAAPPSSASVNPLAIFGDEPVMGAAVPTTLAAVETAPAPAETAPAPTPAPAAEAQPQALTPEQQHEADLKAEFQALPNINADFFAGADAEGVSFAQTDSGLVMRQEGNSRAYLLPNGDAFRTDGKHLEVVGENPRAQNARLVDDGDRQKLAYSDADGNRHLLDINNGDYEVSNRQGTLTQGTKADGSREYTARGTYTNEAGKPVQYENKASFSSAGTLIGKEGFDDLRIAGDDMSFTLPNGVATDRKLVEASEQPIDIAKKLVVSGGFAEEWGGALSLADELLNPSAPPTPPATATPTAPSAPAGQPQVARGAGFSREALPDGTFLNSLPNGIQIRVGAEGAASALDANGQPLEVSRQDAADGAGGYWLQVRDGNGVGYAISNKNMDLMVQSPDGKVGQLVNPHGKVLTTINDNGNQHFMETDPTWGSAGSPGTRVDPRQPGLIFVDGPTGPVAYGLPFPLGGARPAPMPGADGLPPQGFEDPMGAAGATPGADPAERQSYLAGPGETAQGYNPTLWQRLKGAFTNENPWQAGPHSSGGFVDPRTQGYPGSYQQVDPLAAQMAMMNQQNQMMMISNMGWGMMNQMQMMNTMFFTPGAGMFW